MQYCSCSIVTRDLSHGLKNKWEEDRTVCLYGSIFHSGVVLYYIYIYIYLFKLFLFNAGKSPTKNWMLKDGLFFPLSASTSTHSYHHRIYVFLLFVFCLNMFAYIQFNPLCQRIDEIIKKPFGKISSLQTNFLPYSEMKR